jgi:hypothetical protein
MRVTEQQLFNMICESIDKTLMEAGEEQYPDVVGTFDENGSKSWLRRGWDKIRGARHSVMTNPNKNGKQTLNPLKMAGRSAPMGTVAALGMPVDGWSGDFAEFVGYSTLSSGLGEMAGILLHAIFGIALLRHMRLQSQSYYNIANKYIPSKIQPSVAKKVMSMAGVERVKTQKTCISAQTAMKNAIHAYNLVFPKTPTNEKEIYDLAKQKGGFTNNLGQKELNTNFTDRYVGESFNKKKQTINENQNIGELKKQFSGMDEKTAKEVLINAMVEYVKIYSVWEGWTTYINEIAEKFKENGLTLQNSVDGGKLGNGQISKGINNIASKIGLSLPNTGIIPRATSRKMGASQGIEISLRVISPIYKVIVNQNTKQKMDCILLQQDKTNHYFAVPNQNPNKIAVQQSQGFTLGYSQNLITQTIKDANFGTIYVLGNTNSKMLKNITD